MNVPSLSRYVLQIPVNNGTIYYNTTNDCAVKLSESETIDDIDVLNFFDENDFFIDDETILNRYIESWRKPSDFHITISLTESCNLSCPYCYQKNWGLNSVITTEILDAIITYIHQKIASAEYKRVRVSFIGGEPLLARDKIQYFLEHINSPLPISYVIDTNGTLLTPSFVEMFECITLNITLSEKDDHDKYRPFKNGLGTYDLIVSNIQRCKHLLNNKRNILFRYNTNRSNINDFEKYLETIKQINVTNDISIENTYSLTSPNDAQYLLTEEYDVWYIHALELLLKHGFHIYPFDIGYGSCSAYKEDSFKIMSDGSVLLCNASLPSEDAPNILDTSLDFNEYYAEYKCYPPIDEECKACQYLLLCGGKLFCRGLNPCKFHDGNIIDSLKLYFNEKSIQ